MDEFEGRPYWSADHPRGYSAADLQHLEREMQIEVMRAWFYQNFEDPAEKTPYVSAEGGYQWIWGGPYDASEVLSSEFGDHMPGEVIEEVVAEVQADGLYEWAPRNTGNDDIVDAVDAPWPPLGVSELPQPLEDETAVRQEVLDRLAALEVAVEELSDRPPMMGHNRPPEPLQDVPLTADDGRVIKVVLEVVRSEAEQPTPEVGQVEEGASKLRSVAFRLGQWLKQRFDKGADAFAATLGAGLAAVLIAQFNTLYEALVRASQAIANWIEILVGLP